MSDVRTFQGLASSTMCNWPTVSSVLVFDDWILSEAPYGQPIQERKLVIFYTSLFFSTNTQKIAFYKKQYACQHTFHFQSNLVL